MRELIAAKGDDLVRACICSRLELHECAGRLAPLFVRPRHHGGQLHRRMPVERDLHLDARDILAAGNDDVLGAVLDLDVDIIISGGENISSVEVEIALYRHPAVQLEMMMSLARSLISM